MAEAHCQTQGEQKSVSMRMAVYGISRKFPSVRSIGCSQLQQWRENENGQKTVVCLDTRPLEEYVVSHLPGAMQVDPDGEHNTIESLGLSPSTTIVCYCSVGYRSSSFAQKLFSNHRRKTTEGNTQTRDPQDKKQQCVDLDVYNLEGGVFQWACEGREIVNESGEKADTVHPYNSIWGKLLPTRLRHKT